MRYLMDTDHISILQYGSGSEFARLMRNMSGHQSHEFGVSIVSYHEQVMGCNNFIQQSRRGSEIAKGYEMLDKTIRGYSASKVVPFDQIAVEVFADLSTRRLRVATMDLRIASIAISRELILLT